MTMTWAWTPMRFLARQRRLLPTTLLLLMMWTPWITSVEYNCPDYVLPALHNREDGVCGTIHVKYTVKNLRLLENCTMIDGALHLALINDASQEEYDKYSFPKLQEITGYVMMYRVFGLRTLRSLFPNLAVIRGETLFFKKYALVVQEMRHLEDLGLLNLTTIAKGAVQLNKNPRLCHISSIDWGRLAVGVEPSKHQFNDNREELMCPDFCNSSCPVTTYEKFPRKRCWSDRPDACQKNLACNCGDGEVCSHDGQCCHRYCIGGCSGPTASDCYACKDFIYKDECLPKCPPSTFMLSNHLCLTDKECLSLGNQSQGLNLYGSGSHYPKLLNQSQNQPGYCVFDCPEGYEVNEMQGMSWCTQCNGICSKVCQSTKVHTLEDSRKLFGCNKVDGYLDIQIMGGRNIDRELTQNLGRIREVTGYIRIMRSHALLTLYFFTSLQIIGGKILVHEQYSLMLVDNINLQELFLPDTMTHMIIHNGNVSFFGNRHLCPKKILYFTNITNASLNAQLQDENSIGKNNGDQSPCEEIILDLDINVEQENVTLIWSNAGIGDLRQILNYVIYYKEVKEKVRDIYEGKDGCSDDEWTAVDVLSNIIPANETYNLMGLKAYTNFTVYLHAHTLSKATYTARTNLYYFQTSPSQPTFPEDIEATSTDPHELIVTWKPPMNPNGIVTHYEVLYLAQEHSKDVHKNDSCKNTHNNKEPESGKKKQEGETKAQEGPKKVRDAVCCQCPKTKEEIERIKRKTEEEIAFQDQLQTFVYQKRWGSECPALNATEQNATSSNQTETELSTDPKDQNFTNRVLPKLNENTNESANASSFGDENSTSINATEPDPEEDSNAPKWITVMVHNMTKTTLTNLLHFQKYNIQVKACHDTLNDKKLCSDRSFARGRTIANPQADNLNISLITVETFVNRSGEVLIKWQPPAYPNGFIRQYNIKYKRVDLDRETRPVTVCVSTQHYQSSNGSYLLTDLAPGNYSYQLSAHSEAGNGSYTPDLFFSVLPPKGEEEKPTEKIIIAILIPLTFVIIAVICYCVYRRMKLKYYRDPNVIVSQNPHYIPTDELYAPDEWEVPRDTIRLIKELGQGSFGKVFEGLMEDPETKLSMPVAIKTVNDKADFYERLKILKEATTMKVFECHHVVKLLGVVSKGQPALVIMELMALGDLRNYLRKCRADEEDYPDFHPPTANQIRQMAGEIADGMGYLADKKIVHRDLAARNCLVSEDGTVKIADFGMARDVYMTEYYRKDQRALLPVRWMAPESLRDGIFTTMSDIWSYGIVLWEMVTLAEQPYQGLGNEEVLRFVTEGRVMSTPIGCPVDLYNMMQQCWAYNPKHRPTFKYLIELLIPYLDSHFGEVSYFFTQVVKSTAEEDAEEADEGDVMMYEEEDHDNTEIGQASNKLRRGASREEDGMMAGGSPNFYANSSDDEMGEMAFEGEGSNPYLLAGPALISPTPTSLSTSYTSMQLRDAGVMQEEHSPLLLHQGNVQVPLLYPPSSSPGARVSSNDFDHEEDNDDDDDSDEDFTNNVQEKYVRPSRDAKSSSERLKLLSDSSPSGNPRPKMGLLSFGGNKTGGSAKDNEYILSPKSPPLLKNPLSSSSVLSLPVAQSSSSNSPIPSATSSNPALFSLAPVLPSVPQPGSPAASPPSLSKPTLHVDMEGVGSSRSVHMKPTSSVDAGAGTGSDTDSKQNRPLQHNSVLQKSGNKRSRNQSGGDGGSIYSSDSIHSGSEGGSKESSSSSGSRQHFHPGTANGHGPFTHQQAAFC